MEANFNYECRQLTYRSTQSTNNNNKNIWKKRVGLGHNVWYNTFLSSISSWTNCDPRIVQIQVLFSTKQKIDKLEGNNLVIETLSAIKSFKQVGEGKGKRNGSRRKYKRGREDPTTIGLLHVMLVEVEVPH